MTLRGHPNIKMSTLVEPKIVPDFSPENILGFSKQIAIRTCAIQRSLESQKQSEINNLIKHNQKRNTDDDWGPSKAELNKQINKLQSDLSTSETNLASAEKKIRNAEDKLKNLSRDYDEMKSKKEQSEKKNSTLKTEIDDLEKDLKRIRKNRDDLERDLKAKQDEIDRLRTQDHKPTPPRRRDNRYQPNNFNQVGYQPNNYRANNQPNNYRPNNQQNNYRPSNQPNYQPNAWNQQPPTNQDDEIQKLKDNVALQNQNIALLLRGREASSAGPSREPEYRNFPSNNQQPANNNSFYP